MRILATSLLNLVAIAVIAGPEGHKLHQPRHVREDRDGTAGGPRARGGSRQSPCGQCGAGAAVVAAVFSLAGTAQQRDVYSGFVSGAALVVVGGGGADVEVRGTAGQAKVFLVMENFIE